MVRLPSSARSRKEPSYIKVLRRINDSAPSAFGFEGSFLRPGSLASQSDLRPAPDYPPSPILLECAGSTGISPEGKIPWGKRNRAGYLYILWRRSDDKWIEVLRAVSATWDWAPILLPAAERLLGESWGTADLGADLPAITDRIGHFLDAELLHLSALDRGKVLTAIHDRVAAAAVGVWV